MLLFYSDGLTETRNSARASCSESSGSRSASGHTVSSSPRELIERIRQAAVAFSNSETFGDDLTCVAVRIEERRAAARAR